MSTQQSQNSQTQNAVSQNSEADGGKKNDGVNVVGVIAGLKSGQMKDGQTWLTAKLARGEDKKQVSFAAFGDKADNLLAQFADGDRVKLFGYFQPRTFTAPDTGEQITYRRMNVMWSGVPKAPAATETAQTETAEIVPA
jgi:hypothetical protein